MRATGIMNRIVGHRALHGNRSGISGATGLIALRARRAPRLSKRRRWRDSDERCWRDAGATIEEGRWIHRDVTWPLVVGRFLVEARTVHRRRREALSLFLG